MNTLQHICSGLLHLFYPHICAGCGTDALPLNSEICFSCLHELPATGFEDHPENPVEKIFSGRLQFEEAAAHYYFTKHAALQQLLHRFKYGGNRKLGLQLGMILGRALKESVRFKTIDALVPMPLHLTRERKRGYNQAGVLCAGIAAVLDKPVLTELVYRNEATATQTKKNRIDRWNNMQGKFRVVKAGAATGRHLLLVDDVVTTGATLEACGSVLLAIPGVKLSIAVLCFASD